MTRDLFSVPIFFIVFRETVEAAIIVSVLLSFVEQLMTTGRITTAESSSSDEKTVVDGRVTSEADVTPKLEDDGETKRRTQRLIKRMRIQIWAGTLSGFIIALSLGAAFIAVFYTKLTDLWAKTEQIWEGVFSLIAAFIIYLMGIAFLKMDRARIKWRYKLAAAFQESHSRAIKHHRGEDGNIKAGDVGSDDDDSEAKRGRWAWLSRKKASRSIKGVTGSKISSADKKEARGGKWALFLLPFITVLREGLEAVVFVGGVSLNLPAASIPIAVVVGLIAGAAVGYIIYKTGSTATLHWFLVGSTSILFLIGAGLMSKGVGFFQYYVFSQGVGGDVAETGDGPGSFMVKGNVWHLTYGNPETGSATTNGGWQIFNAVLGWSNTATLGTIISYTLYWLLIVGTLIYIKWTEGRVTFFGYSSEAHKRSNARRQRIEDEKNHAYSLTRGAEDHSVEKSLGVEEKAEGGEFAQPETSHYVLNE
ncbi:high-affinity iron transporter, partial [Tremellales sp. Uapishka_1]